MSRGNLSSGFDAALRRPGLAGLLYAGHLVLALIVTVPLYLTIGSVTGLSGFSSELAREFDITLWMDIFEDVLPSIQAFQIQLLWIVPLYLLWKVASSVGVIHTLETRGLKGFWSGVGRFTGRAVIVALLYLVPLAVVLVGIGITIVILTLVFPGEAGSYWTFAAAMPALLILGLALLDLMHDYARMELVVGRKPVVESALNGIAWPFRHPGSLLVYGAWFLPALVLVALPIFVDFRPGGLWGVFLLQQVLLFMRSAATVGWFGSELNYYEGVAAEAAPLIAESNERTESGSDPFAPDSAAWTV